MAGGGGQCDHWPRLPARFRWRLTSAAEADWLGRPGVAVELFDVLAQRPERHGGPPRVDTASFVERTRKSPQEVGTQNRSFQLRVPVNTAWTVMVLSIDTRPIRFQVSPKRPAPSR